LSVIVPAYNEEKAIVRSLEEACRAFAGFEFELVVVDDGSLDATYRLVQQVAQADPRILAVHYDLNRGKGHALRYGFEHTRGERVAFLDADLDLHPRLVCQLMAVMDQTQADVVIGSKLHPLSQVDYPLRRRLLSLSYYYMIRLMFGLPVLDTQTGVKLFRREVLTTVLPQVTIEGFAFDLQLLVLAHRNAYRIEGAPVVLTFQRQRLGRIGLRVVWQIWRDTLFVFWRTR
jgi:glycosyltransferase involved in cell wall biosynthesis